MILTTEQRIKLIENYVSQIVEGLDVESLECMATELITREYETYTDGQIIGEIKELYDDEFLADLLESASDVTVEEVSTI
jgi:hypothetical protein